MQLIKWLYNSFIVTVIIHCQKKKIHTSSSSLRLQCPILSAGEKWVDLSDERKEEIREQYGLSVEDEWWREEVDGIRPEKPSQVVVDGPPCNINGMAFIILWYAYYCHTKLTVMTELISPL